MKHKILLYIFSFILLTMSTAHADSVRISQIDTSELLLNQNITLYVNVTDTKGIPIKELPVDSFSLFESPDGKKYQQISEKSIVDFNSMANYESGIHFLFMIDNSGSMYRNIYGRKTANKKKEKIVNAKNAVITLLKSMNNPKDSIGLVSYNSYYNVHASPINDKNTIFEEIQKIKKPKPDEAYTELYGSIFLAVNELQSIKGRKVIILLTDGENQPYFRYMRKEHPRFGKKLFTYKEPIHQCQQEGISVFAIYFGAKTGKKDKHLNNIANQTGGALFNAYDEYELSRIYEQIVNQVLHEYMITYKATMAPADKKYVKVACKVDHKTQKATRFYFSSSMFGMPLQSFNFLLLLPLLLAFLLLWLLTKLKFENNMQNPSLEVLQAGNATVSTKMFTITSNKTVIGGEASADVTIIGGTTKVQDKHATVEFDRKNNVYVLKSKGNVKVNNKEAANKKVLESGDVISIGGTTIVFDKGEVGK